MVGVPQIARPHQRSLTKARLGQSVALCVQLTRKTHSEGVPRSMGDPLKKEDLKHDAYFPA